MGHSSHFYLEVDNLNNDELLKIANIAKIAWTARDVHHDIWRRLGGFAKESTPWSKSFSPGLTRGIEASVLGKLGDNKALRNKYKSLLLNRATKSYTGNNVGRQLGDAHYKNLGKSITEVDPHKAVNNMFTEARRKFQVAQSRQDTPIEIINVPPRDAKTTYSFNNNTGKLTNKTIQVPIAEKGDSLHNRYSAGIINQHETDELLSNRAIKVRRTYNDVPLLYDKYYDTGVGSHSSYKVLAKEQLNLRDAPDSVYNYYKDLRYNGNGVSANDQNKINMLKKNYGINVKEYGTDLRYRPKEVRDVDRAGDKQMTQRLQSAADKALFINTRKAGKGISDNTTQYLEKRHNRIESPLH